MGTLGGIKGAEGYRVGGQRFCNRRTLAYNARVIFNLIPANTAYTLELECCNIPK